MPALVFDTPQIGTRLDALSAAELHALSFGVIHLDPAGVVDFYSDTESRLSGCATPTALGKDFYNVVAPCMRNAVFRDALQRATAGDLDAEIGHTGDYADRSRFLRIRITSSARGGLWQLHERS